MPNQYAVTLSRDQLVLLRELAVSCTSSHIRRCLTELDALATLPPDEVSVLRYLQTQITLQADFHASLWNLLAHIVQQNGISAEVTITQMILDWLRKVVRLPAFDPATPDHATATKTVGRLPDYADRLAELRRVLENETALVFEEAPAAEPTEPDELAGLLVMKEPQGIQ